MTQSYAIESHSHFLRRGYNALHYILAILDRACNVIIHSLPPHPCIPFTDATRFKEIDADKLNAGDATVLGILGGLALGPLGLVADGALGAMNKKKLFVIEFKDGRKMLGQTGKLAVPNLKQAFKIKEALD